MSDKPTDNTPAPQRPETLVNIPAAGEIKEPSGETLLDLNPDSAGESVLTRLKRTTGTDVQSSVLKSSEPETAAGTAAGTSSGRSSTFSERLDTLAGTSDSGTRYEAQRELGRGGMGVVLAVRDNDLHRDVAMKVMRADRVKAHTDSGRVALQRFVEEAQITGQLEHPNIVPIHELGADAAGRVYFTMKLVHGQPLSEILRQLRRGDATTEREFPLDRLLQVLLRVCDAMSFAHAHGVVHRDLKPENVMVGRFGEVLVMDWGLARITGVKEGDRGVETDTRGTSESGRYPSNVFSMDGSIAGTPAYMAPEQARGEISRIDQRTDVFALGAMLYEILVLRPPYTGSNSTQIIEQAASGEVTEPYRRVARDAELRERLRRLPGGRIPPELAAIAMHALETDMDRRYASAEALKEDVEHFLAGRSVSVHRDPVTVRMAKWVRRHPTLSMSSSAATLVLLLSAAVIMMIVAQARQEAIEQQQQIVVATQEAEQEAQRRATAESEAASHQRQLKEAALEREAALQRRARATELYRQGLTLSQRAREAKNAEMSIQAADLASTALKQAIDQDPDYFDPRFELGALYHHFNNPRAIEYYISAHHVAGGDARSLIYAGDVARSVTQDLETALDYYKQAGELAGDGVLQRTGVAWVALLRNEFHDAMENARLAIEYDSTHWEPWFLIATIHSLELGWDYRTRNPLFSPKDAVAALIEAEERHNSNPHIYMALGNVLLELKEYEDALFFLRTAATLFPTRHEPLTNQAICLRLLKRYEEAEQVIAAAHKIAPDDPQVLLEYGNVELVQSRFEEALALYNRSSEIAPDRPALYRNLGSAFANLGRLEEALTMYTRVLNHSPHWLEVRMLRSRVHEDLGDHGAALSDIKLALESEPGNASVLYRKATFYYERNRPEDSRRVFRQLEELHPDSAYTLRYKGIIAHIERRDAQAVIYLKQSIEIEPNNPTAQLALARSLGRLGRYTEALEHARQAVELDRLGMRAREIYANKLMATGHLEEAHSHLSDLHALDPENDTILINLALVLNLMEQPEEALRYATEAARIAPDEVQAWVHAAQAHLHLGNRDSATSALDRALELESDEPRYLTDIAALLFNIDEIERGLEVIDKALALDASHPRPWGIRARLLDAAGELNGDIASWLEEAARSPTDPEPYYNIAKRYYDTNRMEDAILYSRRALDVNPTHRQALLMLAHARMALGQHLLAVETYEAAARLDPDDPLPWLNIGVSWMQRREMQNAITPLTRAVSIDPNLDAGWEYLGLCESALGNTAIALEHYERAITANPQNSGAHVGAAQMANNLGRPELAKGYARTATELAPGNVSAWFQLGRAQFDLSEYEDAATTLRRVTELVPTAGIAHYLLSQSLVRAGQYEEGRRASLHTYEVDKQYDYALVLAAWASVGLGEHEVALKHLENALKAGVDPSLVFDDEVFEPLHDDVEWKRLAREYQPQEEAE
jgi:tetratricopeptide (TPR) repeat protein/tRNA A-37 threonylcarbamoyl transferase component Bud32